MTRCCTTFCTSTVGAWPDTVIVSSTAPTRRSAFTVAANEADSSMPSRLTVLKPVSVNVTRVGARPQIDDLVLARGVGDDRPDLFDQGRTGRPRR